MKAPRIVKSAEIISDFKAIIKFYDGSSCLVDFSKVALKGAFTKVKTDINFFNTLKVKSGYVMWNNDLTIDGDFLYEQGEKQDNKAEPMPATGYVERIESHYKKPPIPIK
jgi:hypothetical protein